MLGVGAPCRVRAHSKYPTVLGLLGCPKWKEQKFPCREGLFVGNGPPLSLAGWGKRTWWGRVGGIWCACVSLGAETSAVWGFTGSFLVKVGNLGLGQEVKRHKNMVAGVVGAHWNYSCVVQPLSKQSCPLSVQFAI